MSESTKAEQMAEWRYVYQERLGMLCEDGEPTAEQIEIAKHDADESVKRMSE